MREGIVVAPLKGWFLSLNIVFLKFSTLINVLLDNVLQDIVSARPLSLFERILPPRELPSFIAIIVLISRISRKSAVRARIPTSST